MSEYFKMNCEQQAIFIFVFYGGMYISLVEKVANFKLTNNGWEYACFIANMKNL